MADYKTLQHHYEECLLKYGPNAKGMDWPNPSDLEKRFSALTTVMDVKTDTQAKVLDLGCGVGLLIDFLESKNLLSSIEYKGMDISEKMINQAKQLYPNSYFEVRDILINKLPVNSFDYIIMNGLFTEKRELTQNQMMDFFEKMIKEVYKAARKGISFNVMSSHVDWKRDDLFHLELDNLVSFLVKSCSRRIKINMDYGLYEYTVYVMK